MTMNLSGDEVKKVESRKSSKEKRKPSRKHKRQYSQVIAENIIESPTERDFRDNKNNNIWGIRELDVKQKPEHN